MEEPSQRRCHFAVIAAIGVLLSACTQRGPEAVAFVDDRAGLLTPADESSISGWHAALLAQYGIDYRVLTVDSADDLSALAVRTFESAEIGKQSGAGRGLLLVVDASGDKFRTTRAANSAAESIYLVKTQGGSLSWLEHCRHKAGVRGSNPPTATNSARPGELSE